MRRPELLLAAILVALTPVLGGCAGGAARAPVSGPDAHRGRTQPPATVRHAHRRATWHVVRRGETLYSIAWRHGRDWRAVARWNGLRPPYRIYPGQRLRVSPPRARAVRRPAARDARRAEVRRHAVRRKTAAKGRGKKASARTRIVWRWPTDGRVLRRFDPEGPGKKGIAIGGRVGQPVRAAADGRVVYSGSGLVGYGKLIIIKHDETWLSAYGHNSRLRVKEGQRVRAGQRIADMGRDGKGTALLHFEIRRDGRPVDPLKLLPRR